METKALDDKKLSFAWLPRELRDQIYEFIFQSTRLGSGRGITERINAIVVPKANSLAILRTCRQINEETSHMWLSRVVFEFQTLPDMFDKFLELQSQKPEILSQIRYVRTGAFPRDAQIPLYQITGTYATRVLMTLLKSMRLERLTIFASYWPEDAFNAFHELVSHSCGWKELHYISTNANMLVGHGHFANPDLLDFAHSVDVWRGVLLDRDGDNSGAEIAVYQEESRCSPSSIVRPHYQIGNHDFALEPPFFADNPGPDAPDWESRELLLIAKRGRGAFLNGVDFGPCPWPPADVPRDAYIHKLFSKFPCVRDNLTNDEYHDVDEYFWGWVMSPVVAPYGRVAHLPVG